MKSKWKLSRRGLTNILLVVTLLLAVLYQPIIGSPPSNNPHLVGQWATKFTLYVCGIIFLVLLIALLAVREARSVLEKGREDRMRLLDDLISNFPEKARSEQRENRSTS